MFEKNSAFCQIHNQIFSRFLLSVCISKRNMDTCKSGIMHLIANIPSDTDMFKFLSNMPSPWLVEGSRIHIYIAAIKYESFIKKTELSSLRIVKMCPHCEHDL